VCSVGSTAAPRPYDAVLGLDTFGGDALRIHLAADASANDDHLFVFPDIAGDEVHRSRSCDGVFPHPFRGGGTLVVGGTQVPFASTRITLNTCLAPRDHGTTEPDLDPKVRLEQSKRGADALLVASTAVGITILDESAYERFREAVPVSPKLDALPEDDVLLPSGVVHGHRAKIPSIAFAASSSSDPRGPCRQVYASHKMIAGDCTLDPTIDPGEDCPCTSDEGKFCTVPAVMELNPATSRPSSTTPGWRTPSWNIDVLVVSDDDATLQALRTELRPDQPEVDGILGTDLMRMFELDIDRPNDRLLMRCTDPVSCTVRPELVRDNVSDRCQVQGCMGQKDPTICP
jgi:hypothetical protein